MDEDTRHRLTTWYRFLRVVAKVVMVAALVFILISSYLILTTPPFPEGRAVTISGELIYQNPTLIVEFDVEPTHIGEFYQSDLYDSNFTLLESINHSIVLVEDSTTHVTVTFEQSYPPGQYAVQLHFNIDDDLIICEIPFEIEHQP